MMTDPASAIKREVHQSVELQIQTLRQEAALTSSELLEYHARSGKSPCCTENWIGFEERA
jgi:hypothetical protein